VQVLKKETEGLAGEQARTDAAALVQLYEQAGRIISSAEQAFQARKTLAVPGGLGAFKKPVTVTRWNAQGLTFTLNENSPSGALPPQTLQWRSITVENVLDLHRALSSGGSGSGPSNGSELSGTGALAFALGADAAGVDKLKQAAALESALAPLAAAAERYARIDREDPARKLIQSAFSAADRKDLPAAQSAASDVLKSYGDTAAAKEHGERLKALAGGSDTAAASAAPEKKAEPEKPEASTEELAAAELKKLGFTTVNGAWSVEPGARPVFGVKEGGSLQVTATDGTLSFSAMLAEGAALNAYARVEADNPIARGIRERMTSPQFEAGRGYGVETAKNAATIYGDRTAAGSGGGAGRHFMQRMQIPFKMGTQNLTAGPLSVVLAVKGDDLLIQVGDRSYHYRDKLRAEGGFLLELTGAVKLTNLKFAK
jgi:hypothetical protein